MPAGSSSLLYNQWDPVRCEIIWRHRLQKETENVRAGRTLGVSGALSLGGGYSSDGVVVKNTGFRGELLTEKEIHQWPNPKKSSPGDGAAPAAAARKDESSFFNSSFDLPGIQTHANSCSKGDRPLLNTKRWLRPHRSCDVTGYAETYATLLHQNPFSKAAAGR